MPQGLDTAVQEAVILAPVIAHPSRLGASSRAGFSGGDHCMASKLRPWGSLPVRALLGSAAADCCTGWCMLRLLPAK